MFLYLHTNQANGYRAFMVDKGTVFGHAGVLPDLITIHVNNTGQDPELVNILSRSHASSVKIYADTIPLEGLIYRLNANPMKVEQIQVIANPTDQMENPIRMVYNDALGNYQETSITPAAAQSMFQSRDNRAVLNNLNFIFGLDCTIETIINPKTTLTLILKVKQLFNDPKQHIEYKKFLNHKRFRNFMRDITL